jgi:23S rRNA (guanosine2251-2'-O)-methyltransferase
VIDVAHRIRTGRSSGAKREVLYGFHPVLEALIAGRRRIYRLMLDRETPSDRRNRLIDLADRRGVVWQAQTAEKIRQVAGSDQHQGVGASVSPLPLDALDAILSERETAIDDCLLMLLDGIVDPNNLGAIVRTAHCAGVHALVIPKDRAAGATPAVSKTSAGALEHTRLCRVTNLADCIQWLKKRRIWVAGLAMQAERSVFQTDLKGPLALVLGGEHKGLRRLVRQKCDYLLSIPLRGRVDSLNASAAAAVVLYEAVRQRQLS